MPVYPMLDHRMISALSQMRGFTMWDADINERAWSLHLRDIDGPIPPYAFPALNEDDRDFLPTISFVGDLEPFHDENVAYIEGLKSAGIHVEFKVFRGDDHGFEVGFGGRGHLESGQHVSAGRVRVVLRRVRPVIDAPRSRIPGVAS